MQVNGPNALHNAYFLTLDGLMQVSSPKHIFACRDNRADNGHSDMSGIDRWENQFTSMCAIVIR